MELFFFRFYQNVDNFVYQNIDISILSKCRLLFNQNVDVSIKITLKRLIYAFLFQILFLVATSRVGRKLTVKKRKIWRFRKWTVLLGVERSTECASAQREKWAVILIKVSRQLVFKYKSRQPSRSPIQYTGSKNVHIKFRKSSFRIMDLDP